MSAKLEWKGSALRLVAEDRRTEIGELRRRPDGWVYELHRGLVIHVSEPYERKADCAQDCESEVRRLLREAGVEVE